VELGLARLVAVVAENTSVKVTIRKRHRGFFKLSINSQPRLGHIHHRLATDRTGVLSVLKHAFLTRHVKKVAARRYRRADGGAVNVFHADRAVGLRAVLNALVAHVLLEAEAARVAVDEIIPATNSTNSTAVAVKLLFVLVVVEATDGAEVGGSKYGLAAGAGGRHGLTKIALTAYHLFHRLAVQSVRLFHGN